MAEQCILEIDAGNTSFKWRVVQGDQLLNSGRGLLADCVAEFSFLDTYTASIGAVYVASVAGKSFDLELVNALETSGINSIHFAKVEPEVNGVHCGYQTIGDLGVDRWMAVLAASNEFSAPLVIVDAGSAITIDVIDADKKHIGGYIFPGWGLLRGALIDGTAITKTLIPDNYQADFISTGATTLDAIGMGRLLVCAAAINQVCENFLIGKSFEAKLVCTGGDSPTIMPHLRFQAEYRPNLVLDGLRVALG